MSAQLRVMADKVSPQGAAKHLTRSQRKRLARNGHLVITGPKDKHRRAQMRLDLNATFAS